MFPNKETGIQAKEAMHDFDVVGLLVPYSLEEGKHGSESAKLIIGKCLL